MQSQAEETHLITNNHITTNNLGISDRELVEITATALK